MKQDTLEHTLRPIEAATITDYVALGKSILGVATGRPVIRKKYGLTVSAPSLRRRIQWQRADSAFDLIEWQPDESYSLSKVVTEVKEEQPVAIGVDFYIFGSESVVTGGLQRLVHTHSRDIEAQEEFLRHMRRTGILSAYKDELLSIGPPTADVRRGFHKAIFSILQSPP